MKKNNERTWAILISLAAGALTGCVVPTSPASDGGSDASDAADARDASDVSAEPDAGESPCTRNSDCPSGQMCVGSRGCDVAWRCVPIQGCTASIEQYCSCRGVTVSGSGQCPPEPFSRRGSCDSPPDGGELVQTHPCGTTQCDWPWEYCVETIPRDPSAARSYSCHQVPPGCLFPWNCSCFASVPNSTCVSSGNSTIRLTVSTP